MDDGRMPPLQTAAVIESPGPDGRFVIRHDLPVGNPGPGEVLIRLACTGICGSELRALRGWGSYNPIVGHEGVGVVVELGAGVDSNLRGRRAGVKWLYSACSACAACARGHGNNCPRQLNTGKQRPGTLQRYVVADARYLTLIPDGVRDEEAAPLLCAGLTMMGAVSKLEGEVERGGWVVVQGAAGGLGHLGVQIAAGLRGFRVIAMDAGRNAAFCKGMGAEVFVDYLTEDAESAVMGVTGEGAHAVIVVPESEEAYRVAPKLVRSMGTIVCVGLPHNDFQIPISVAQCAAKALTIKGAMVGTDAEMEELLQEATKGRIRASVERFHVSEVPDVISRMTRGEMAGRAVVCYSQTKT
ncbi:Alcohol dehydrogenase 3, mitochondrial [Colletotrichum plurivorum]|uniref:Alcohol dehydrogenase 3, mitochondrial n=1 Tax=Colletotrichum plurivorum TaxID=2175906 RepID=A0A8H6NC11_9PEZI|nr:Alcohol dehydrogenase 3, mitochondrial [Colletotrichum plurivorum]